MVCLKAYPDTNLLVPKPTAEPEVRSHPEIGGTEAWLPKPDA
jgi:hypothetical protein